MLAGEEMETSEVGGASVGPPKSGLGGAEQTFLLLLLPSDEAAVGPGPDNNPDQRSSFH